MMSFDTSGTQPHDMTIKLENILPSLAKNLYGDDWRITIRELLQNCHDAIAQLKDDATQARKIDIIPDVGAGTLTFRDNGVGMTLEEVERYLATVGHGRKREELQRLASDRSADRYLLDTLIGQYGIGFLSAFIIADQVEVLTRRTTDQAAPGVRAIFTGETRWYSSQEPTAAPGTQVTLKLKQDAISDPLTGEKISIHELLNFEQLRREVRRFGDLVPYPIYVHRGPDDAVGDLSNVIEGPWERANPGEANLLEFLTRRYPDDDRPLAAFPFRFRRGDDNVEAHGIIYFPRASIDNPTGSVARVDLFTRRMFISQYMTALLPRWAKFVGVVVECPDLTPTLDRNDVIRHESSFVALKQALAREVTKILETLARLQPRSFADLRSAHQDRLYAALLADSNGAKAGEELFFRSLINHIPFTVIDKTRPAGEPMTLPKYREEFGRRSGLATSDEARDRIYFLPPDQGAIGQYRAMIVQRDIPVVLATHPGEQPLIEAYGQVFQDEVLVDNVAAFLHLFVQPVDQARYEQLTQFLLNLELDAPDEVSASRFDPNYVAAIMTLGNPADPEDASMLLKILNEMSGLGPKVRIALHEQLKATRTGRRSMAVVLNDNNLVVRRIIELCAQAKRLDGVVADVLHEIYHIARAYAEPAAAETEHHLRHRNVLLRRLLDTDAELAAVRAERDRLLIDIDSLRKPRPRNLEPRTCALLLTDLRGSTRMAGFLDKVDSASILREYAAQIKDLVEARRGRIEQFTGDGVFAYFGIDGENLESAVQDATDCAWHISGFTQKFFTSGQVHKTLLEDGGITVDGSRTVVHSGKVMYGDICGAAAVVGPQVVALFRACNNDKLFQRCPIVLSAPAMSSIQGNRLIKPIIANLKLDPSLPTMTFYPHPNLAPTHDEPHGDQ